MRARWATTFQSLRIRNYRLFATGQLTKLLGVWMQFIAQDWLVLELSGDSAYALGVVTALQFAPILLLTLYGGKLADRMDKRKLLLGLHIGFSVLALGLGVLVATGLATLHVVFVFAALMGTANALETPVRQSFVSELVPRELLPNALSLAAATFNSARIVGPMLAGLAIAVLGTGPVFLLNTVTYLAPVLALRRMTVAELYREPRTQRAGGVRDGLRYVWRRDDLLLPVVLLFVVGMAGFNFQLTLAVLAKTVFHTGPATFGVLSTSLAVGALAGALASTGRRDRPSVQVVLTAAILFGVFETAVGLAPNLLTTVILLLPTGFFMIYFAQATNQRLQLGTDATYRGRVMALFVLVFLGTTPVGAPAIGWLSEQFGPRLGIVVGGAISFAAGVGAMTWQLRRVRRARLAPGLATPSVVVGWQALSHGERETAGVSGS